MKHNLLFSAFLFVALFFTPNVWATTTVDSFCGFTLSSGSSHPTMTWETNFFGDVIITLHDGEGSTNTTFRASGMAVNEGLNAFYVTTPPSHSNQEEAKKYFYAQMDGNQFILRRRNRTDDAALDSREIRFYEKNVLWKCDENASCEEQIICHFQYEKSYICDATLDRPYINSVAADGTVSFNTVTDATSYVARVYNGLHLLHEQAITPNGKLTYKPYIAAETTYEVTIQAYGAGSNKSRESLPANWTTTGSADNPLPQSKYCDYIFQTENSGNSSGDSRVRLTIETRKGKNNAKDTLLFAISKYDENDASAAPYWRSNGFQQGGLKYDGNTFTDYFQLVSSPNNTPETRYVKKDVATVEYGKKITFNVGANNSVEWGRPGGNTNASTQYIVIDYIYGTNCSAPSEPEPEHSKPTSVSVNDSKVISFTAVPVEEAVDSYNAVVKLGETTVKTVTDITSGTTVIDYASTSATTYQVYVQAIKGGDLYSTSEAFDWELSKEINAPSEFCGYEISDGATPAHKILLTWETNHVGDVIIRLADGENTTGATFRGNGMGGSWASNNWKVKSNNGATTENASTYFTQEYMEGGTTYILRKKANVTLPDDAVITFGNNAVEWRSNNNAVNNAAKTLTMNYTYGSSCATLPLPTITSITEAGVITFPAVIGATSYTARVYDGQTLLYTQENIISGAAINYASYYSATFQVTLQAFGSNGAYSDESAGTNWTLSGDLSNLPASNVCNQMLRASSEDPVYISIETDNTDGSFYITMQPANAAFRGNEYIVESGLKYDGHTLTDYFTRTLLDGTPNVKFKTIKYTPIDRKNVQYGKDITFNKFSEGQQLAWYDASGTSRNSPNLSFTYIYGTKCSLEAAFEHSSNVSLYADHADEDLTVNDAMTINGNGHEIGDITVNTAGELNLTGALTANKLLVYAKPGASGQVIGAANLNAAQAWTEQQLLGDADDLNPSTDWYCFTVPFNVNLANGVYTATGDPMTSGVDFLVWTYDGELRAATGNGWKRASGTLEAGKAYLIGFKDEETAKSFRFLAAGALAEPTIIDMVEYAGGSDANNNWNAVGNPTLKHINVSGIDKVQLYQNASQTFQIYQTGEKSFVVGTAFFAQGTTNLDLAAASYDLLAPARRSEQASRMQACVEIYRNGRAWADDRMYIAASEDAEEAWQQGRDVPTLNSTSNRVALMHTLRYGMKLASVDVPWAEQVDYELVITAPSAGAYTLHAATMTDEASVWVTRDDVPVWDLSTGDYPLNLLRGTETAYGLRLIHVIRPIVTDIEENQNAEIKNHKLIIDGQLYISREGHLYNAIGQIIY